MQQADVCALKNELNIFDNVPTQILVDKSYYETIQPVSAISQNTPIEFNITSSGSDYIDLNDTRLYVKFKIVVGAGADAKKFKAGLTNLPISSLFSNASLTLNHVKIEGDTHLTAYTNYIHTLLSYSPTQSKNTLEPWGYVRDGPENVGSVATNAGLLSRTTSAKSGSSFIIDGPLPFDFFRQRKYLLSNVPMEVTLQPATPGFSLMAFKTADGAGTALPSLTITIEEALLAIRRVQLLPSVTQAHEQGLMNYNAIYPYLRSDPRSYTIQKGSMSHTIPSLFNDRVPKLILVCMVTNIALNGTVETNPFNLQHFNIKKMDLQVGVVRADK